MTLRKRMLLHIGSMMAGCVIIAAAALWGIEAQRQSLGGALEGHHRLRNVYEIGTHMATARAMLSAVHPNVTMAARELQTASAKLEILEGSIGAMSDLRSHVAPPLREAIGRLNSTIDPFAARTNLEQANDSVNKALNGLATASADIRQTISRQQESADARRRFTWMAVFSLSAIIAIASAWIGYAQYRSVMGPLGRLGRSVRRIAAGHLDERVAAEGDREFAALAIDFNRMAGELNVLCRDLERQVAAKSRELSQSERLASVGYLAAGVAHEINNPLGIIAGYGQRSLRLLRRGLTESTAEGTARAIQVMCDEAFRCKHITDRLLSLARPSQESRTVVSLADIVRDVISNFTGLPEYADRTMVTASGDPESLQIPGRDGEIKQVVINLVINALQAVPRDGTGRVSVSISRINDDVELVVADNGRGMSPETRDRVFEPFFTSRRGDNPGVGLGLSITHAIVRDHNGSIRAESDGPGLGSRFIVRFPAFSQEVQHAGH